MKEAGSGAPPGSTSRQTRRVPTRRGEPAREGYRCPMLPLAVSGPAYIGAVVIAAVLFLWWLLRANAREEAAEHDEEQRRDHAE
jgi:hypothetical protein